MHKERSIEDADNQCLYCLEVSGAVVALCVGQAIIGVDGYVYLY